MLTVASRVAVEGVTAAAALVGVPLVGDASALVLAAALVDALPASGVAAVAGACPIRAGNPDIIHAADLAELALDTLRTAAAAASAPIAGAGGEASSTTAPPAAAPAAAASRIAAVLEAVFCPSRRSTADAAAVDGDDPFGGDSDDDDSDSDSGSDGGEHGGSDVVRSRDTRGRRDVGLYVARRCLQPQVAMSPTGAAALVLAPARAASYASCAGSDAGWRVSSDGFATEAPCPLFSLRAVERAAVAAGSLVPLPTPPLHRAAAGRADASLLEAVLSGGSAPETVSFNRFVRWHSSGALAVVVTCETPLCVAPRLLGRRCGNVAALTRCIDGVAARPVETTLQVLDATGTTVCLLSTVLLPSAGAATSPSVAAATATWCAAVPPTGAVDVALLDGDDGYDADGVPVLRLALLGADGVLRVLHLRMPPPPLTGAAAPLPLTARWPYAAAGARGGELTVAVPPFLYADFQREVQLTLVAAFAIPTTAPPTALACTMCPDASWALAVCCSAASASAPVPVPAPPAAEDRSSGIRQRRGGGGGSGGGGGVHVRHTEVAEAPNTLLLSLRVAEDGRVVLAAAGAAVPPCDDALLREGEERDGEGGGLHVEAIACSRRDEGERAVPPVLPTPHPALAAAARAALPTLTSHFAAALVVPPASHRAAAAAASAMAPTAAAAGMLVDAGRHEERAASAAAGYGGTSAARRQAHAREERRDSDVAATGCCRRRGCCRRGGPRCWASRRRPPLCLPHCRHTATTLRSH